MPEIAARLDHASFSPDRIVFPGSPWPRGHAIAEFHWSARIKPSSGLWFDLHLRSAKYAAEDEGAVANAGGPRSNWKSREVWRNYQKCTLSSIMWDHAGFKAAADDRPFDFETLNGREFRVDSLTDGGDEPAAFGIYLQGHDSTADHTISFKKLDDKNHWSL